MSMEQMKQNEENRLTEEWHSEFNEIAERVRKNIPGKVGVDAPKDYPYAESASPEKDYDKLIELNTELHNKRESLYEYDILNKAMDDLLHELEREFNVSRTEDHDQDILEA